MHPCIPSSLLQPLRHVIRVCTLYAIRPLRCYRPFDRWQRLQHSSDILSTTNSFLRFHFPLCLILPSSLSILRFRIKNAAVAVNQRKGKEGKEGDCGFYQKRLTRDCSLISNFPANVFPAGLVMSNAWSCFPSCIMVTFCKALSKTSKLCISCNCLSKRTLSVTHSKWRGNLQAWPSAVPRPLSPPPCVKTNSSQGTASARTIFHG